MSRILLCNDKRFRPCPFCGALPQIYWEDEWNLVIHHSRRCFPKMIVSSRNFKKLLEEWNGKMIWECTR